MEKLINVENEWIDSIDASEVEGAVRKIEVEVVLCAMNRMKIRKASGSSGFALELFKAGGNKCLKSLTHISYDILLKDNCTIRFWTGVSHNCSMVLCQEGGLLILCLFRAKNKLLFCIC